MTEKLANKTLVFLARLTQKTLLEMKKHWIIHWKFLELDLIGSDQLNSSKHSWCHYCSLSLWVCDWNWAAAEQARPIHSWAVLLKCVCGRASPKSMRLLRRVLRILARSEFNTVAGWLRPMPPPASSPRFSQEMIRQPIPQPIKEQPKKKPHSKILGLRRWFFEISDSSPTWWETQTLNFDESTGGVTHNHKTKQGAVAGSDVFREQKSGSGSAFWVRGPTMSGNSLRVSGFIE